jgi:hypothetical protein
MKKFKMLQSIAWIGVFFWAKEIINSFKITMSNSNRIYFSKWTSFKKSLHLYQATMNY